MALRTARRSLTSAAGKAGSPAVTSQRAARRTAASVPATFCGVSSSSRAAPCGTAQARRPAMNRPRHRGLRAPRAEPPSRCRRRGRCGRSPREGHRRVRRNRHGRQTAGTSGRARRKSDPPARPSSRADGLSIGQDPLEAPPAGESGWRRAIPDRGHRDVAEVRRTAAVVRRCEAERGLQRPSRGRPFGLSSPRRSVSQTFEE